MKIQLDTNILARIFSPNHSHYAAAINARDLVTRYQCKGKVSHDARIVASMVLRGIDRLLTFNAADFNRFAEIQVIDPAVIATGS
jgi:predicted nucleic acid-binding protein